jgi:hypothetical protein
VEVATGGFVGAGGNVAGAVVAAPPPQPLKTMTSANMRKPIDFRIEYLLPYWFLRIVAFTHGAAIVNQQIALS